MRDLIGDFLKASALTVALFNLLAAAWVVIFDDDYAKGAYFLGITIVLLLLVGRTATVEVSIPFMMTPGGNGEIDEEDFDGSGLS